MNTNLRLCIVVAAMALSASGHHARMAGDHGWHTRSFNDGAIEGRVFDSEGHPASGVSVYNVTLEHPLPARPRPSTRTITRSDDQGRFHIGSVSPGRYSVEYANEGAGYPDTASLHFLDPSAVPQVEVRENEVTRGVEIHLGPKAAKIIVKVLDERRVPIENGELFVCQASDKTSYFSSQSSRQGRFELTMAPVPVTLKVSAVGYEDWYYYNRSEATQTDTLELEPGAVKELTIHLTRR